MTKSEVILYQSDNHKRNKMKYLKRIGALVTGIAILATSMLPINRIKVQAAEYWPDSVEVTAQSAIVMDVDTGTVLYSKNEAESHYPASITKIMTALVILDNCELDDIVTFSPKAVYENEGDTSHIARDVNEKMTVEDTLYGMMLESANECAWALGEHLCDGDMDAFVKKMNDKAKELGCVNTHFNNPNGLPDEEHWTCAYDMALISRAAYQIPKFAEITGTKRYTIQPTNKHSDPTYLNNHHSMLHYYNTGKYIYDYCMGGKTGYTVVAGSTLVTYAKKDNMTLVCVVMKDESPAHWIDTRNLFDYCFDNFNIYNISENASISENNIKKTGKLSENMDLIKIDSEGTLVLPKTASFYDAQSTVKSYIDENDETVVGQICYKYAGRDIGSANLVFATNDVSSYPFDNLPVEKGGSGKEYIQVDYLRIVLYILCGIMAIILILFIKSKSSDLLLAKHRFRSRHPKKPATDFKKIKRHNNRRRRRRR